MSSNIMNILRKEMNRLGSEGVPFLFIIDFEMIKPLIYPLDRLPAEIRYQMPGQPGERELTLASRVVDIKYEPVSYDRYREAFDNVKKNIWHGNTYLLNLTFPSVMDAKISLPEIFEKSRAKYKILLKDNFVVFSPETFVRISGNKISSYPMKGTIDASIPGALNNILEDEKELSEHNTIVDLIRNDLSMVADDVEVKRYRYPDLIRTGSGELIQISSEIEGTLARGWERRIGDIIIPMLPAGSVSGAPKESTTRIIRESEIDMRGYYSGVFGLYDGKSLDSAVMIRYIEQRGNKYVYRSGGGITYLSDPLKEYDELIAKIYVPSG